MLGALGGGAAAPVPVRLAVLFMPNGVHPGMWTPAEQGSDFQLTPTLEPLADFREDILVLTNLGHKACRTGDGHYVKTAGLLTGTRCSGRTPRTTSRGDTSSSVWMASGTSISRATACSSPARLSIRASARMSCR